jgi:hypothetical protein
LYQVRATLTPNIQQQVDLGRVLIEQCVEDMKTHAPRYAPPLGKQHKLVDLAEPTLMEIAIFDPHIGMLAWGKEVGAPYDTDIAVRDYGLAADKLLSYHVHYNVDRVLFLVGNDLLHVDGLAQSVGGGARGGATSAGTPQDIDTRLPRMFTAARRAVVAAIDKARLIAPVDVLVVPGNHDEQSMYRMGEVLNAWYRLDERVSVIYGPNRRKYYGYPEHKPRNALMFVHGEDYRRQRDNLPLQFATECPPELWVHSTHREIHTGHNHIKMEGRYTPTSGVDETRGIRTRSLPGLTPEDSWHYKEGYKHRRTASVLFFRASGGVEGLHEFNL